ncbi:hypothetical protein J5TS1_32120 [Bacillus licheniformis]|jgi:hypothetical protein|uniref:hypothetical protein n=1 Tax=Bacillus TaxID=1386 RepID=UPI00018C8BAF|nr:MULTISPECIES: hypothetical protein [Bacillus]AMR10726.1 hypothetical protein AB684_11225 [Bacillus licheniformis]ARC67911.1 hypothetical protein B34_00468 [Bacillus licheniformis]KJH58751.1 hypothetical protein UF14_10120 [Bacillus licheniformis]KYC83564.1 hypothetical protein B4091_2142 [Bacillus licheniformis]MBK4208814.1 hypothetical protein [Bacillus licheniformis]
MSGYSQRQICPHCDHAEEEHFENLDQDSDGRVTCHWCGKDYYAMPQYEFLGFEVEKICEDCGEQESECYCEVEVKLSHNF